MRYAEKAVRPDRTERVRALGQLPDRSGSLDKIYTLERLQRIFRLLESACVALLGHGEGLEPLVDIFKAFVASRLGHPRIHLGVFVRLTGHGCG